MRKIAIPEKVAAFAKKYRLLLLLVVLGVVLLLLPSGQTEQQELSVQTEVTDETDAEYVRALEARLSELLAQIEGVGQVNVLLTLQSGKQTHYKSDVTKHTDGTQSSLEEKTVILSRGSAYDEAAVTAVSYPKFQGALIVCQGADRAAVQLAIVGAVSSLTGLSSDKIAVVKMK